MGRKRIYKETAYKASIIFEEDVKDVLEDIMQEHQVKHYSPFINFVLRKFCLMPEKIKVALNRFFEFQIADLEKQISCAGKFEIPTLEEEKAYYTELLKLISRGKIPIKESGEKILGLYIKEIPVKDGLLVIPSDWIDVNPDEALNYKYVAVLECRNADKFGIPHFIMHCQFKYGKDYPDDFEKQFIEACYKAWPDFKKKVIDKQVTAIPNENGMGYLNETEYLESPTIGIFHIWEEGDEHLDPSQETPYGSILKRI